VASDLIGDRAGRRRRVSPRLAATATPCGDPRSSVARDRSFPTTQAAGRTPFDRRLHTLRNQIEPTIARHGGWRCAANRSDKLSADRLAAVTVTARIIVGFMSPALGFRRS
jgi:hypothetical protein